MFQKRIAALLVIFLLGASGLVSRLFEISVLQHGAYSSLAEGQQSVIRDILPKRGTIWFQDASARNISLAAESVQEYALTATPANVTNKPAYAKLLASISGVDEAKLLTTFEANGKYMPPLKHGLSKSDVEAVAAKINGLERALNPHYVATTVNFDAQQGGAIYFIGGVIFEQEYGRVYPEGQTASQLLGFVNTSGLGQYGFEGQYDAALKGSAGTANLERDSLGNLLQQTGGLAGADGSSYELSIDRNVQYQAEQQLAAEVHNDGATGGTVIVMDPRNGSITAMANVPTYDANNYGSVSADQFDLFTNTSISQGWEPGSIFKDLVMGAAMNEGLVTPETTNTFDESVTVEGHRIETALRKSYGTENMAQVLANSDNVAMVWVANKLGNQKMYQYLQAFGLGQRTGVDLRSEISGNLPLLGKWQDIDRATISFGQGIAVTPLQIISAYAAIANHGQAVRPHVVQTVISPSGVRQDVQPVFGTQVLKPEIAKQLLGMMQYTVQSAHNRAGTPGYQIGGKTGTAQIPDPVNGGYLPDAYNHSFVGVGTTDDPHYVILVKLDHPDIKKVGLYAESTAVPLFGRLSTFLLHYYQIAPTGPVPLPTPTPTPTSTPTPTPTPTPSPVTKP